MRRCHGLRSMTGRSPAAARCQRNPPGLHESVRLLVRPGIRPAPRSARSTCGRSAHHGSTAARRRQMERQILGMHGGRGRHPRRLPRSPRRCIDEPEPKSSSIAALRRFKGVPACAGVTAAGTVERHIGASIRQQHEQRVSPRRLAWPRAAPRTRGRSQRCSAAAGMPARLRFARTSERVGGSSTIGAPSAERDHRHQISSHITIPSKSSTAPLASVKRLSADEPTPSTQRWSASAIASGSGGAKISGLDQHPAFRRDVRPRRRCKRAGPQGLHDIQPRAWPRDAPDLDPGGPARLPPVRQRAGTPPGAAGAPRAARFDSQAATASVRNCGTRRGQDDIVGPRRLFPGGPSPSRRAPQGDGECAG